MEEPAVEFASHIAHAFHFLVEFGPEWRAILTLFGYLILLPTLICCAAYATWRLGTRTLSLLASPNAVRPLDVSVVLRVTLSTYCVWLALQWLVVIPTGLFIGQFIDISFSSEWSIWAMEVLAGC